MDNERRAWYTEVMKLFVVIDVGCHECGVGSEPVGAYTDKAEAYLACTAKNEATDGWRDGGQTIAEVFEIETP